MLILALSVFGAWSLFLRIREASSSAARAALAVRLLLPAFLGGSLGLMWRVAPAPPSRILALLGLGVVLFVLCVVSGLEDAGPFEPAGAALVFFVVAASLPA